MLVSVARGLKLLTAPVVSASLTNEPNDPDDQTKEDRTHKKHVHRDKEDRDYPILLSIVTELRSNRATTTRGL